MIGLDLVDCQGARDGFGLKLNMTPEDFRKVCSRFATGVAILTVSDTAGFPHGLTVNSFTSVSVEPPLVLVCIGETCASLPHFQSASHFGLSFLAEDQQDLSTRFAFVPERRFDGVDWRPTVLGVPMINGAIASMECHTETRMKAGDHTILIGEVLGAELYSDARPLLYFGSGYRKLDR